MFNELEGLIMILTQCVIFKPSKLKVSKGLGESLQMTLAKVANEEKMLICFRKRGAKRAECALLINKAKQVS